MRVLREESGFTLPELLIVMTITTILLGGLTTIFGVGLNTGSKTSGIAASQTGVTVALDRLDYEVRCSSLATLVSSGAGVTLTLPNRCSHATGTVTWCASSGSLIRYSGGACSGSGQTLITGVTSSAPFSCVAPVGNYPALNVALTVTTAAQPVSQTDLITLMNAPLTTSTTAACS